MLLLHPMRCGWGVCLKQNPHIFQHLRSATLRSFTALWWHPGPVPTLDLVWAPSDCIPDPPHSPPVPHSLLCRWSTPPLFTPTPVDTH